MCSMIGWLQIGTSGLGLFAVTGRNREPSPPAMTTAFMCLFSHYCETFTGNTPNAIEFAGDGGSVDDPDEANAKRRGLGKPQKRRSGC